MPVNFPSNRMPVAYPPAPSLPLVPANEWQKFQLARLLDNAAITPYEVKQGKPLALWIRLEGVPVAMVLSLQAGQLDVQLFSNAGNDPFADKTHAYMPKRKRLKLPEVW